MVAETKTVSPEQREKLLRYYDNRRKTDITRMFDQRYTSIKQRCNPNDKHHPSSTKGMAYLTKKEFIDWCGETMAIVLPLYKTWQDEGFQIGLSPSVDRIDSTKGYVIGNLQWLSFEGNIKKGNK